MAVPKIAEFDAEEKPTVKGSAPVRATAASPLFGLPIVGERIALIIFGGVSAFVLSLIIQFLALAIRSSFTLPMTYWVAVLLSFHIYLFPPLLAWSLPARRFAKLVGREERVAYFILGVTGFWLLSLTFALKQVLFRDYAFAGARSLLLLYNGPGILIQCFVFAYVLWWLRTQRQVPVTSKARETVSRVTPLDVPLWKTIFQSVGGFLSAAVLFIILIVIFVVLAFADVFQDIENVAFPFVLASALLYAGELFIAWRLRARGFAGLFWGVVVGVIVSALLTAALIFLIYNFSM